jgi:hypothetical protein
MDDMLKLNRALEKIRGGFITTMNDTLSPKIKTPDFVYHYTSINSFMSIIKNNNLWFSHASYLNDPMEITFGIDVIMNILSKNQEDFPNILKIIEKQRTVYNESSLDIKRDLTFIFSYSELADELPSWIQYGDNGYGICLGFITSKLLTNISSHYSGLKPGIFFPVQYYSSWFTAHNNNIHGFEGDIIGFYKEIEEYICKEDMANDINIQRTLYDKTKSFASFIKNDFHAGEREWRYILFTGPGDRCIKINPTDHGAKMFYNISFGDEKLIGLIYEILIGPKHNHDPKISAALEILILHNQGSAYNTRFSHGMLQ